MGGGGGGGRRPTLEKEDFQFHSPAIKLSARGRRSGGAAVFIDRSFMPFVTPIECSYDDN